MATKKATTSKPPTSLRDALSRKVRPSRTYRMPVSDPGPAEEAVRRARSQLRTAHLLTDEARIAAAETALADAETALEACWQPLKLWSIGGRLSELIKAHPPTEEQKAAGADWNVDTMPPALIAAAAVEVGMTAEEWAAELANEDHWSLAERSELFTLALEANTASSQDRYRQRGDRSAMLRP